MKKEVSDFRAIVEDNERATRQAIDRGDFVQAILLIHTLVESLLRLFLHQSLKNTSFKNLIEKYEKFLHSNNQIQFTFVMELTEFNKRRNRIVHNLWKKGYTNTNEQAESVARVALSMYGLLIEWLETFDSEIVEHGFQ